LRQMEYMIEVACAIILGADGRVLAAQRSGAMSMPDKWEFPGGKLEQGESAESCLVREIREELDVEVRVIEALEPNIHSYASTTIRLIPFTCRIVLGEIRLREHRACRWVRPGELLALDWAEADIPCVINFLRKISAS
ncbi:MAG TPA: (deoxy)nucleoside triphosphate pyrophosphohydrolase, partial [Sphingobacteriaceae bacterium]